VTDLHTIRGVELIKVGTWEISTGEWTVTPEDLVSVIEAHRAGVLRKPVVKIGHNDPRFDGNPALGYVDNLRLAAGGQTLVGDLVNVPGPVAKLLPNAYPDRSVEALCDYTDQSGRTWPLVLDALALLGATAPGIDSLQSLHDVGALYGVAAKRVTLAITARPETRIRTVQVAAARRRRTHRTNTTRKAV
jgi:hypothetical protein